MVSRRLILKLYLWLLLALTLSIAGAAAVFTLLSPQSFEERAQNFLRGEMSALRDTTERLLRSGLPPEVLREVLDPLGAPHDGALAVLQADGTPVLLAGTPAGAAAGVALVTAQQRQRTLAEGVLMEWRGPGRALVALPIQLPDGNRGVFAVTFNRFRWEGHGHLGRLFAGLAAVLVTLWLLSWPLAAHLARPLQRMARAADALGQGDLAVRIAPRDIQRHTGRWHRPRRDEIGRLAESFNRMAENLQRLVLGHKRLLADISHELRSPLARLRLALELARGAQGEEQARYLATLERQADAMEQLIGELLLHARLDEAPYELHAEPLDVATLVNEALAAQRPEADARSLLLRAHVPAGLGSLRADRSLLLRALNNALRNAVAYSPERGAVDVTVRREGGRVTLAVRDEGPGVPAAELERIFEPFVRTDTARSRGTGGVGLGLAIVKRCMEAHGGGAGADPGPQGRGLVLTLWLPDPDAV
jgi:signal transduction histidine kinase